MPYEESKSIAANNEYLEHGYFVSLDFDHCLFDSSLKEEEFSSRHASLFRAIKKRMDAASVKIGWLGSNRQSQPLDQTNSQEKKTSSAYPIIRQLIEGLGGSFYPFLLADAYASVYREAPQGYSYRRALTHEGKQEAYHHATLYEETKLMLLYTQIHLSANHLRNCDFVRLSQIPTNDSFFTLSFISNAAYVLCNSPEGQALFYVNKMQKLCFKVEGVMDAALNSGLQEQLDKDIRAFECIYKGMDADQFLKGITLDQEQLQQFPAPHHQTKDCPFIFDFVDDNTEILGEISSVYNQLEIQKSLPANVILRLSHYTVDKAFAGDVHYPMIVGKGAIDLHPQDTLLKLSNLVLGKLSATEESNREFDYKVGLEFGAFMRSKIVTAWFQQNRALQFPTVNLLICPPLNIPSLYDSRSGFNFAELRALKNLYHKLPRIITDKNSWTFYKLELRAGVPSLLSQRELSYLINFSYYEGEPVPSHAFMEVTRIIKNIRNQQELCQKLMPELLTIINTSNFILSFKELRPAAETNKAELSDRYSNSP